MAICEDFKQNLFQDLSVHLIKIKIILFVKYIKSLFNKLQTFTMFLTTGNWSLQGKTTKKESFFV